MSRFHFVFIFSFFTVHSYSQYCVPAVLGSASNVGISNVTLNTINNNTATQQGYQNYTALSTTLLRNATYNLSVTVGFTSQATMVWVDWNQNNILTDVGESYSLGNIAAGVPLVFSLYVPPNATLGNTLMRIASDQKGNPIPTPCATNQPTGDIEDYTINISEVNMVYDSSVVFQVLASCVMPPVTNQRIIGIEIFTSNTLNALQATQFNITTTGTTSLADITNAQLWFTANSPIFATTTLFGSAAPAANFNINGAQTFQTNTTGKNYFWLTFDVVPGATAGDNIDAQCINVVVGGVGNVPLVTNPAGNITISNPNTYIPPPLTYVWYFGRNAGIDFKCSPPKPLTDGKSNSDEGCSSICDANGNILFYTDGVTVWDQNHTAMTNGTGLMGATSTAQSALIVPLPGGNTIYYVFTQDYQLGANGFRYSIVDVALNEVTVKNQPLLYPATEQIASVVHCNGRDFWIMTHEYQNKKFYAYLLTPTGLNVPVISSIGPTLTGGFGQGIIKFSPNGKHLAVSNYSGLGNRDISIYDFCNATGVLSNYINIPHVLTGNNFYYGLSFSSDGSKLYKSESSGIGGSIFQYDFNAPNFLASQTFVGRSKYTVGSMQLAPDLKIYGARGTTNKDSLFTIDFPNTAGAACNFVDAGFWLNGKMSSFGLPNLPENYYNTDNSTNNTNVGFSYLASCPGDTTTFTDTTNISCFANPSWSWNFGDPGSGAANSSSLQNPIHIYSAQGTYTVSYKYISDCISDSVQTAITISPAPTAFANNDTTICSGINLTLTASGGTTYTWSNTSTNTSINVTPTGNTTYSVVVNTNGCKDTANINVAVINLPAISINGNTSICTGDSAVLSASGGTTYIWSTGSSATILTVHPTGSTTFSITGDNGLCSDTTSIHIVVNNYPVADAGPDDTICRGESAVLNGSGGTNFLWNTGETTSTINISPNISTSYTMTTLNGACPDIDSVMITVFIPPVADAGSSATIIVGSNVVLTASGGGTYSWYSATGLSCIDCPSPTASPLITTKYYVLVTDDNGCTSLDSVTVTVDLLCYEFFVPNVFSPNADGQNDVFKAYNNCVSYFALTIYDRWGEKVFETTDINIGWDGTYNKEPLDAAVFSYIINAGLLNSQEVHKKGNVTLIR